MISAAFVACVVVPATLPKSACTCVEPWANGIARRWVCIGKALGQTGALTFATFAFAFADRGLCLALVVGAA